MKAHLIYKKIFTFLAILTVFFTFPSTGLSIAIQGPTFTAKGSDKPISRGKAVDIIVSTLDLEEKKQSFLKYCYKNLEECIFAFSARSDYDGISIKPLILYPDVFPAHPYYKSINTASLLNLVSGYFYEPTSPFKPEENLTRIQALKIILGATDMVKWKEKFELSENENLPNLPFKDLDEWWYGRYVETAYKAGLIEKSDSFRPNEAITDTELEELLVKTIDFQNHVF